MSRSCGGALLDGAVEVFAGAVRVRLINQSVRSSSLIWPCHHIYRDRDRDKDKDKVGVGGGRVSVGEGRGKGAEEREPTAPSKPA